MLEEITVPITWDALTLDEHRGAQSAIDRMFADIHRLGVDNGTHYPEILELLLAETQAANADRARRLAEEVRAR